MKCFKHISNFTDYIKENYILSEVMPKRKVKHSYRVFNYVKQLSENVDVTHASLYHDYIERGGDPEIIKNIMSDYSYQLVLSMTKSDNIKTLDDIKNKISSYSERMKADFIKIKISDRTDNLLKKKSKKYLKKSIELFKYLISEYPYRNEIYMLQDFLIKHLSVKIPDIKNILEYNEEYI